MTSKDNIVSGSMLIPNYLGEKTALLLANGKATANPPDNALADAKAALKKETKNPTVSSGNVRFLTYWIKVYSSQQEPQKNPPAAASTVSTMEIDGKTNVITKVEEEASDELNKLKEKFNTLKGNQTPSKDPPKVRIHLPFMGRKS